ncbi:hypothetical protein RvY_14728 [Ramazzottius varieornatus]|uniref:Uncharacterized protein n=1 Tax=Ramazzottius varieornatus TaxID=947166 RepID=A0A1D1VU65_RAMVA|nr:hypothetical protein RvY_14728 [Ramazzottius varieornatus]
MFIGVLPWIVVFGMVVICSVIVRSPFAKRQGFVDGVRNMSRIRKWIFRIEIARFTQWDAGNGSKSYWTFAGFGYPTSGRGCGLADGGGRGCTEVRQKNGTTQITTDDGHDKRARRRVIRNRNTVGLNYGRQPGSLDQHRPSALSV